MLNIKGAFIMITGFQGDRKQALPKIRPWQADGGILNNNHGTTIAISDNISGNIAGIDGGGIFNNSGMVTMKRSIVEPLLQIMAQALPSPGTARITAADFSISEQLKFQEAP